jgi:hypothetical protein
MAKVCTLLVLGARWPLICTKRFSTATDISFIAGIVSHEGVMDGRDVDEGATWAN